MPPSSRKSSGTGTPRECRDQLDAFFAAGAQEVRLVFNEPDKDTFLAALRAMAPRSS